MSQNTGGYQINEKDIEGVLNYLKIHDPEHATPEVAIEFLEYFKAKFHEMAHTDLEKLEQVYEEFKKMKAVRQ